MKYTAEQLIKIAENFEKLAKKDSSLDPKAKVRNRGKAVFQDDHPKVKDHKTHFPINNADQARNALARAGQYSSVPPWFSGTLEELKNSIRRKVKQEYPSIDVTEPKKKK
jgi:ElaB/YqjD/DUF883 family membrane-anchored ribosome-binding protein